jgi:hypothetical protein
MLLVARFPNELLMSAEENKIVERDTVSLVKSVR